MDLFPLYFNSVSTPLIIYYLKETVSTCLFNDMAAKETKTTTKNNNAHSLQYTSFAPLKNFGT